MENFIVTSLLQKVQGDFKNKEPTLPLAAQRPGQEVCSGQLKAVSVFFHELSTSSATCSAQCEL